ncbi:MAG TPA: hypothetical protein VEW65_04655 [Chryseolinea sp.]|nr:hypothetical protein [Chryseolinea sp.]
MRYHQTSILTILAAVTIVMSCDYGTRTGAELSQADRDHIKGLGLLDEGENIILFDRQSDFKTSGNFITDQRLASYWIDKRDETQTSVDFGLYSEIDTILTKDLSRALTYASYLEVVKNDGKIFKVYVDGDSTEVRTFFDRAISEWRVKSNR